MKRCLVAVLICIAVLLLCPLVSMAEGGNVLTLPKDLKVIEEEAFYGSASLDKVVLPEGVEEIQSKAFAGSTLKEINLPDSITYIAEDAFADSGLEKVVARDGTYAYEWALRHRYFDNPASDFEYTISDGKCIITKYIGSAEEVNIPRIIDNAVVTSIGNSAFSGCSSLASVTIPEGVTSIERYAFSSCSSLTKVTIPGSVTSIGNYTFQKCSDLTSVTLPDGVTSIGRCAFCNCSSLTSVTIGSGVTSIGDSAFRDCSSLTSVTIPESVTSISYEAFRGCSSLTSVTIPDSVTSIGSRAFSSCRSLASVSIPDSVTSIGSEAFSGCRSLTNMTIPDGVTSIGSNAFHGCSSLTSMTIPDSVTSIGGGAFQGCSVLTSVTIPDGVTSIKNLAFYNCRSLTSVRIPEGVTSIGNYAFFGCSSLASVTIPEGVTSIGILAFSGCSGLTSVTIPGSVTSIGSYAFQDCSALTSVTILDGVTSIGEKAFQDCSSLTGVVIPEGVTGIGRAAFAQCSSLASVTIPDSMNSIGELVFYNCSSLTSVTIPEGVTSIDHGAFAKCSSLASVTIPEGVTSIDSEVFYNCSSLTSVTIPEGVTSIGDGVFIDCISLSSINGYKGSYAETWAKSNGFGSRFTPIDPGINAWRIENGRLVAYYGIRDINEIPSNVTSIGPNVFANHEELEVLLIGESVTQIDDNAFTGCTAKLYCYEGSYAESWLNSHGFEYRALFYSHGADDSGWEDQEETGSDEDYTLMLRKMYRYFGLLYQGHKLWDGGYYDSEGVYYEPVDIDKLTSGVAKVYADVLGCNANTIETRFTRAAVVAEFIMGKLTQGNKVTIIPISDIKESMSTIGFGEDMINSFLFFADFDEASNIPLNEVTADVYKQWFDENEKVDTFKDIQILSDFSEGMDIASGIYNCIIKYAQYMTVDHDRLQRLIDGLNACSDADVRLVGELLDCMGNRETCLTYLAATYGFKECEKILIKKGKSFIINKMETVPVVGPFVIGAQIGKTIGMPISDALFNANELQSNWFKLEYTVEAAKSYLPVVMDAYSTFLDSPRTQRNYEYFFPILETFSELVAQEYEVFAKIPEAYEDAGWAKFKRWFGNQEHEVDIQQINDLASFYRQYIMDVYKEYGREYIYS